VIFPTSAENKIFAVSKDRHTERFRIEALKMGAEFGEEKGWVWSSMVADEIQSSCAEAARRV
jgi:hypothetical protein